MSATETAIPDGVYFLYPYGEDRIAATFYGGRCEVTVPAHLVEQHRQARDGMVFIPDDTDELVTDPEVRRAILDQALSRYPIEHVDIYRQTRSPQ